MRRPSIGRRFIRFGGPSAAEMLVGHGPRLLVDVAGGEDTVMVAVRGELDIGTAAVLRERLRHAEAAGGATVVVDLRAVTFLDSAGIAELMAAHQRARATGRRLAIVRGRRTPVGHVLEITAAELDLETADSLAALHSTP